jgi:hypothetical protein
VIKYKDFGRIKIRGILLTNNQIDTALEILLTEKLIEDKNLEYKGKLIDLYSYAIVAIFTISLYILFLNGKIIEIHSRTKGSSGIIQSGIFIIIICMCIFSSISRNILSSIFYNIKKRKKQN